MIMANNSSGSGGSLASTLVGGVGGGAAAACPPGLVGGIPGAGASSVAAALNSTNSDLWKECVLWLQRCKVLPPDHVATEEIRSLALTLRDGVMLCNLVIFLDPKCLDPGEMTKRPQMAQFLCCKNIKLFIDVCRNHFKLREADLFEPSMLYDLTHFHRVLITLSKLSQCAKVQKLHPNIVGFNLQLSPSERSHSDEAIYKDLHSTTTDNNACNGRVDEHINTKEEEVYQDLCALQRTSRSQITSATSFEQRDYVIRELIDTESNYLDVLNALKMKFMAPLERYLTPDDIKQIFPRIKELADIHTKFLDKLRDSLQPHAKMKMGQVFLEFREPFLIYGEYCSCLLGAIDFLADICKKNQIIEQLVQQCEREYNVGKLQLRDILSVPMQRILKYHLLLDKLVKETSPAHEDYRSLERAKEAMIDVSQYINEVKRDSDHLVIIQKVKDSIIDLHLLQNGNDLLQYGRLLLDGELHIKAHEDQKTKLRYAFVFDKILILVKPSHMKTGDMQYTFRDSHNLAEYQVEQSHSRRTIGRDSRFKYQLLLARKSGKTAFTLYLKSEPERDKWRKALTEAMENLDPPGCRNTDHKMEIFTFDAPTTCRHCSKFLKGRIHQGYRCKVCEIAVHKGCISSTGRCKQNIVAIPPPVCDRQLAQFNWFVGNMDRETAQARLEHRRVGTYLLRVRPQGASNPKETMYALSLKTDDNVIKHMKINQDHSGDNIAYCLSSRRHFKNIVELVSYYERNDLGENFAGLNQSLQWPYREVLATAIYDFEPKGNNQLALKTGCQVLVIGKDGDNKGWWRGKIGDTVGYFPKEYVQEHPPTNDEL
ncbi:protein vav isoform X1 [Musca domestica]|uniref:Protein vav isoform X1 n=2 Tax=Musca domestica TaxID=7370 RepID=A0ABM3VHV8_MUSDO|nr:protein vav isoform X1 [Musca domestica]XP_058985386.1 protein vav isoform X1 [Musca domestica]